MYYRPDKCIFCFIGIGGGSIIFVNKSIRVSLKKKKNIRVNDLKY